MAKYNIITALTLTFLPFVLPPLMSPSQSICKVRGHHREADTIGLVINPWQAKLWRLGSITTCGSKLLIANWELFSEPSSVHHSFLRKVIVSSSALKFYNSGSCVIYLNDGCLLGLQFMAYVCIKL